MPCALEMSNTTKRFGGLGIIDLQLQNQALVIKWLWMANKAEPSLWKETLTPINQPLPLEPSTIIHSFASFVIDKLQPIMEATSIKNLLGQLLWNLIQPTNS
jgi:hypothetical protein